MTLSLEAHIWIFVEQYFIQVILEIVFLWSINRILNVENNSIPRALLFVGTVEAISQLVQSFFNSDSLLTGLIGFATYFVLMIIFYRRYYHQSIGRSVIASFILWVLMIVVAGLSLLIIHLV